MISSRMTKHLIQLTRRSSWPRYIRYNPLTTSCSLNHPFNPFNINKHIEDLLQTPKPQTMPSVSSLLPQSLQAQIDTTKDVHLKLLRLLDYQKPLRISVATMEHYLFTWFEAGDVEESLIQLSNALILKLLKFYAVHGRYDEIAKIYLYIFNEMKVELKSVNMINEEIIRSLILAKDLKYGLIEILCEIYKILLENESDHIFRFYFNSLVGNNIVQLETNGFDMSFQQFSRDYLENEANRLFITQDLMNQIKEDIESNKFNSVSYLQTIQEFQLYESQLIIRVIDSLELTSISGPSSDRTHTEKFLAELFMKFESSSITLNLSSRSLMKLTKYCKSHVTFQEILTMLSLENQSELINYRLRFLITQNKGDLKKAKDMAMGCKSLDLIDNAVLVELMLRVLDKSLFEHIWHHYSQKSVFLDSLMIKGEAKQIKKVVEWRCYKLNRSSLERLIKNSRKFKSKEFAEILTSIIEHSDSISVSQYFEVLSRWERLGTHSLTITAKIINTKTTTEAENYKIRDGILKICVTGQSVKDFVDLLHPHKQMIFVNLIFRKLLTKKTLPFAEEISLLYPTSQIKDALAAFKVNSNNATSDLAIPSSKNFDAFEEVWSNLNQSPNQLNSSTAKKLAKLQKSPYMERMLIMKIMENSLKFMKKKKGGLQLTNERLAWCVNRAKELNIPDGTIKQIVNNSGISKSN